MLKGQQGDTPCDPGIVDIADVQNLNFFSSTSVEQLLCVLMLNEDKVDGPGQ